MAWNRNGDAKTRYAAEPHGTESKGIAMEWQRLRSKERCSKGAARLRNDEQRNCIDKQCGGMASKRFAREAHRGAVHGNCIVKPCIDRDRQSFAARRKRIDWLCEGKARHSFAVECVGSLWRGQEMQRLAMEWLSRDTLCGGTKKRRPRRTRPGGGKENITHGYYTRERRKCQ